MEGIKDEEDLLAQLKSPLLPSEDSSSLDSAEALAPEKRQDEVGGDDEDDLSLESIADNEETKKDDIDKFAEFDASLRSVGTTKEKNGKGPTVAIMGMDLLGNKISRVEKSWLVISQRNRIGAVGLKFFLKMFDEHPELVELFPFGEDSKDPKTGKLKINTRTKRHLQAHAAAVMRVVGTCVAGLTSLEDLVPRLRNVGATHKIVGVQNMHYDILYRHLVSGIKEEVGPENWDEETEDAWEQAYISITDLIKRPSKRLETEPLRGWGLIMLVACLYFTLITPIRFAGFFIGRQNVIVTLDILDALAALAMTLDFLIDFVQSKLRLKQQFVSELNDDESVGSGLSKKSRESALQVKRRTFIPKLQNALLRRQKQMIRRLHRWNMDRWMPWPKLDLKVLLSFVLQGLWNRNSLCAQPGLHWTQLFGLLRLSCASRVLHFVQCAENNALLGQQLSADRQLTLRIIKLLVRLAFITHVSACMWCAVARVGLGVDATKFEASPFFPNPEILSHGNGRDVFNSYSRAIHWAFVNLSGIGGVESVPTTSLECWTVLIVHMMGAVFYAIVTGSVITVLEEASQNENKIGSDIVKLSNYLVTARVSTSSKERIIRGYMMRNVLTEGKDASSPVLDGLENGDEILGTLPNYLRAEVGIYARAETIRRRVKFFSHCSNSFLVALSSSLSRTRTLLTGDYLIKRGQQYDHEFMVVESGTLQIRKDGQTVATLNRGDCIGKGWLMGDERHSSTVGLKPDGTASVSIRAMTPCIIMGGLTTREEVQKLENAHIVDFKLLRAEAKGHNKDENEKKAIAMRGIAKAVRVFKQRKMQRLRKEAMLAGINDPIDDDGSLVAVSRDDLLRVVNEKD